MPAASDAAFSLPRTWRPIGVRIVGTVSECSENFRIGSRSGLTARRTSAISRLRT